METVALIVVVAIHLLLVNLASAGPMAAVALEWRASRWRKIESSAENIDTRFADEASAVFSLVRISLIAAIVGVGLGLMALFAVVDTSAESASYAQAVLNVTRDRWWFMGGEVVFYLACLVAFLFWPANKFVWFRRVLLLAAGTNLLYHFPAFFTILAVIAQRPELYGAVLDKQLYHKLAWDPEVFARVLHVWLASFAVAGVTLVWIAERIGRSTGKAVSPNIVKFGGRIALWSTMLQILAGIFVLLNLPMAQQTKVMAGDALCTSLFGLAVLTALGLMHQLAMISLGDASRRRLRVSAGMMFATILLMTATLHLSRG